MGLNHNSPFWAARAIAVAEWIDGAGLHGARQRCACYKSMLLRYGHGLTIWDTVMNGLTVLTLV